MYVCLCKAITDKDIRQAVASGADSLYALREALGVASNCGSCAGDAEKIIEHEFAKRAAPRRYVPVPYLNASGMNT